MTDRWPRYDLLTHRAKTTPDRTVLIDADTGREWTVRELDAEVDELAAGLEPIGVSLGTRVGLLLPTRPAFVRLVHAVARLGGVLVPLNVEKPTDALSSQAEHADVDVLICGAETAETARELGVETTVSIDPGASTDENVDVDRLPSADPDGFVPISREPDALAVIMFTSGTTGEPKGVRLTRRNLLASAEASAYRLGVAPDDRWLCCLPMYHMGGLAPIVRTALYGTTLVVQREFDAEATGAVIDEEAITGVSLVPTMLDRMLDAGWEPPAALDAVLLGGAPADESLIVRATDRDVPVSPTYGTTETASQVATATPAQATANPGTVGQPLVNTTVRIIVDGKPAEPDEVGEVVVSGPTVTPGYLEEDRTAEAFDEAGLHTGDLGYRDADGRIWIEGRSDDRIVSGGENVDPETVAAAIRKHPNVEDAAVVGLPDPEWGERVAALVVGGVDPEAVEAHCRDRLAVFEVPKTIAVTDELPRTASGTVDRGAVAALLSRER
ncbi:o-succinylbenzoate--CoA ligase [Halapricum hydrolyticum]|uniref:O-succinylbenzoate--CoA ligase n=1 Tax=Halapricum hydrolyticum TaxID=2979991 RepID=A0AAE3IAH7_9EURY|nr:o-succinylbenzoate--CoA ligase [Halapricum hydrolyticum]MCU4717806.1 o-succinylbenzoate--CoA ligase [Halapricum hydrolyticum]MCU4726970.1 o-succinylbenzoate--CoA ligase [Halapricum hydrolyticum]